MSEATQSLCFMAGANSIFTGDKLLTAANAGDDKDAAMLAKLGLVPMDPFSSPTGARSPAGSSAPRAPWAFAPSRSIRMPMPRRCMCGRPMRRCISAPVAGARELSGGREDHRRRARHRAEAIHPGYGFPVRKRRIRAAVIDAGLIWVGPRPASDHRDGAEGCGQEADGRGGRAGDAGLYGREPGPRVSLPSAAEIGYPVLIKAVAGGGGKGMRQGRATQRTLPTPRLLPARGHRARSATIHVLIEKYIQRPRHIEVQVFGDSHGNVVHLFERDCSLQRRHQKVIEEAPAPGMDEATRERSARRGARGEGGRLCRRRHDRVHRRRVRRPARRPHLVHGNEHPAAGRTSGDRGNHRRRSGGMAVARGERRTSAQEAG
jgi:hypothetical protein